MTAQKTKKTPKSSAPTAAQRIEILEKQVENLGKMIQILAEELDKLSLAGHDLHKKVEAAVKVAATGELNEKKVDEYLINQQVLELKNKVEMLIHNGVLTPADEVIGDNLFIVGKEMNKEGEIVSPRTQTTLQNLPEDVKSKLIGKKIGDLVQFSEDKLSFLIDELYIINEPKAEETIVPTEIPAVEQPAQA